MTWQLCGTFLIILAINLSWSANATSKLIPNDFLGKISESRKSSNRHIEEQIGTKWAVLVAGSQGFANYRHQADVCHAYQVLKKGGLKDENIIVFMYDDIAYHPHNPRPGVIINKPDGDNVYNGVPKDYTGNYTTAENFYAVLLGNRSALTGGSGKVLNSGPNDQVFIFYSDHGAPGFVTMPVGPLVFGRDLVNVLQKKHQANGYQKMVFYLEACEAGSMFDGLLQDNINIYVNTASNPTEPSYAVYCPGDNPPPPSSYDTCLGDLFSVSWMEDCDKSNLSNETLAQQFEKVKLRTGNSSNLDERSHVTQYGNLNQSHDLLSNYMMSSTTSNPSNIYTHVLPINTKHSPSIFSRAPNQRDADLLYLWTKKATINSNKESYDDAKQKLYEEISSRKRTDYNINKIGKILFANANSEEILSPRPAGQPLVDDWDCFKSHLVIYERYCGALSSYGMKYTRLFGNTCNAGVTMEQMIAAARQTCSN